MGTLGQYLHNARVAKDIDLREAAQQTRISVQYLIALEQEDFTKLPGEVFVKGFLKNYSRYLKLDEAEVMKRYAELKPQQASSPAPSTTPTVKAAAPEESVPRKGTSWEPFIWGAGIAILLIVFLLTYFPARPAKSPHQPAGASAPAVVSKETVSVPGLKPSKIYLEVVANEDTWLLVRTDDSPQKKAVLKKDDRLTWSADDRFVLSYGSAGALKLLLDGVELAVNGTKDTVVRDLIVTRTGIVNQPVPLKQAKPMKPKSEPTTTIRQGKSPAAKPQALRSAASPSAQPSPQSPSPQQAPAAVPPAVVVNPIR